MGVTAVSLLTEILPKNQFRGFIAKKHKMLRYIKLNNFIVFSNKTC